MLKAIEHLEPNREFNEDLQWVESAPNNWQIMEKINEIIEYLNSKEK